MRADDGGATIPAGGSSRFHRRALVVILLGSAVVRAGLWVHADRNPRAFDFPDSHRYIRVARNVAAGLGPIESMGVQAGTDPVYPLLLSLGVRAGITDEASLMSFGRAVGALLGVVNAALIAALARLLAGERAAVIAAGLVAFDPILLFFNGLVLTETPYITLLMLSVLLMARAASGHGGARIILAALCAGLGSLTRSSALLLPVAMVVPGVWIAEARRGRRLGLMAVFVVVYAAALVPWAARNYALLGRVVVVRTGAGASLLEGLGSWADGGPGMDRIIYPAVGAEMNEAERDRVYVDAALAWARSEPLRAVELAWDKLVRTWAVAPHAAGFQGGLYRGLAWAIVPLEYAAIAAGLVVLIRRRRFGVAAILIGPAAYFSLVHMIFVGSIRYRVPAMPLLFIAGGVGIEAVLVRIRKRFGEAR